MEESFLQILPKFYKMTHKINLGKNTLVYNMDSSIQYEPVGHLAATRGESFQNGRRILLLPWEPRWEKKNWLQLVVVPIHLSCFHREVHTFGGTLSNVDNTIWQLWHLYFSASCFWPTMKIAQVWTQLKVVFSSQSILCQKIVLKYFLAELLKLPPYPLIVPVGTNLFSLFTNAAVSQHHQCNSGQLKQPNQRNKQAEEKTPTKIHEGGDALCQ